MATQPTVIRYHSYLLHIRRVGDAPPAWDAALQDVRTGEWRRFTELEALFGYLAQAVAGLPAAPAPDPTGQQEMPPGAADKRMGSG